MTETGISTAVRERYDAWWEGRLEGGPILKVFLPAKEPGPAPAGCPYAIDPRFFRDAQWEALKYGMAPAPLYVGLDNDASPQTLKEYWLDTASRLALFSQAVAGSTLMGDAFLPFFPDFGSAVVASFLNEPEDPHFGNRSIVNEGEPLGSLEEIEALIRFSTESRWWGLCRDFVHQALATLGPGVTVGFPNLGGALDILACLRGTQNMLMDLVLEPERVKSVEMALSQVWVEFYVAMMNIFRQAGQVGTTSWVGLWSGQRFFPIQCDIAVMISPPMFRDFAIPSLRRQTQALDHSVFHFHHEGPRSIPILDLLLDMDELHAIQWSIGVEDPPDGDPSWLPIYRRITERGKGLELLKVSPERVGWLVDNLPADRLAMNVVCQTPEEAKEVLSRNYHG